MNTYLGKNLQCAKLGVIAVTLACLTPTAAKAYTITFSGGSGNFAAPYTENGFTITPTESGTTGPWEFSAGSGITDLGNAPYNPVTEIYSGGVGILNIARSDGGLFTVSSFDLAVLVASYYNVYWSYSGYSGMNEVENSKGTVSEPDFTPPTTALETISTTSPSTALTSFQINIEQGPQTGINWVIDNIYVSPVPEPSTVGLLSAALVPLLAVGIRWRAACEQNS